MGPRFLNRGFHPTIEEPAEQVAPSMRPRFLNRGSDQGALAALLTRSFNGAAISQPRIFVLAARPRHRSESFNGAAISQPRICRSGPVAGASGVPSMGPRFLNRGSGAARKYPVLKDLPQPHSASLAFAHPSLGRPTVTPLTHRCSKTWEPASGSRRSRTTRPLATRLVRQATFCPLPALPGLEARIPANSPVTGAKSRAWISSTRR